jgi:hypothetical protein
MRAETKRAGMAMAAALGIIALCAILATALLSSAGRIRRANDAGPNRPLLRAECQAALQCAAMKVAGGPSAASPLGSTKTTIEITDLRGLLPLRSMDEAGLGALLIACGTDKESARHSARMLLEGYRKDARFGKIKLSPAELSYLSGLSDPIVLGKLSACLNGAPDSGLEVDPAHCEESALRYLCAIRNVDPTLARQKLSAGAKPEDVFQAGTPPTLTTLPEAYLITAKAKNPAETLEMSKLVKRKGTGWEMR